MADAVDYDVPNHIPPELVFDFDVYNRKSDPRLSENLHEGLLYLHRELPDIFWSPRNGGHWVVTRAEDLATVFTDTRHFTSVGGSQLPKREPDTTVIPITLDPPTHLPYRQILMRYFAPKAIKAMEGKIRLRARSLIDGVKGEGRCDFVSDIAIPLPVSVFMEMIGWPLDRLREFRALVEELTSGPSESRRVELNNIVYGNIAAMLEERAQEPRDDLMSRLLAEEIDGRRLSMEEALSMCFFLFVAGLDTVANAAGFFVRILARSPELQARLAADPTLIPDFVDEGLRTCGVVNTTRVVKNDVTLKGTQLRKDEIVLGMLSLAGFDDRVHSDATRFDIDRKTHKNMIFGSGVHLCAGHHLARTELNILIEEWVDAVPRFRMENEHGSEFRLGFVMALKDLPLIWPRSDGIGEENSTPGSAIAA